MRKILIHYHIFKNAGTSVDACFLDCLGSEKCATREFDSRGKQNKIDVQTWVEDHSSTIYFASHTIQSPFPESSELKAFPIIFLRHPLIRIYSAYLFEKAQGAETFGSTLARNTSFAGYVETQLSLPRERQCRNFQSRQLNLLSTSNEEDEILRSKEYLYSIPFVGVVEHFDKSIKWLSKLLEKEGIINKGLNSKVENVNPSMKSFSVNERLQRVKHELGDILFSRLEQANSLDLELYEIARNRLLDNS